jgi:integrase
VPHFPKPFFRSARNAWYVQIGTRQVKLGADRDSAFQRYHELMSEPIAARAAPPQIPSDQLVVVMVDEYLDWCQKHRSSDTYRWYKDRLNDFCQAIPAELTLDRLKPHHVQKWVDAKEGLASGSRRNLIAAVKRAMNWAEEQGYVERSPIAHLRKPACGRKEQIVSNAEYQALLDATTDQEFRDLLTVTWETGCRPQESLRVEARHVDLQGQRWVFPPSESKGKKTPRVVYLTPKALEVCKRLMTKHAAGPLFRNTEGAAWTPDATNCRFFTLKRKLKVRYSLYALRHSWVNRLLTAGCDAFSVALLAGHTDPSMLAKHYQHLSQSPAFLLEQARRASA